ncbi:MAG: spermidine/putrescine ABC transporter substrate-binding protein, partial [Eubacteriales bacterium]|nr:spermidine/putrescine ABC transporter substrate-binding protein [Eubacteriales bacterium]
MKKILCLALVCFMLLGASLCLTGCKNYDGEINVYNWGQFISDGMDGTMDVIAQFEEKYNIKVNYTTYETNEALYNMLKSSNSSYDVVVPSDYMVEKLIAEGLVQEINFDNIPNYKNIDDNYKNLSFDPDNKYSIPYSWGVVALCYNTEMVGDVEVTGFSALWEEELAGNILMFDNSRDAMAIAMCLTGGNPQNATKEDIDKAYDKLIEQKPLLKKYVMDLVFNEMEGSQAAIAPYYAGDIYTMMQNNEDLMYCLPEEGSNFFVDSMCIPTSAKNKADAEKFINFLLEAEVAGGQAPDSLRGMDRAQQGQGGGQRKGGPPAGQEAIKLDHQAPVL